MAFWQSLMWHDRSLYKALVSRFWDGSGTCWYKPNTSITRAPTISSGSCVWAVTRRRLVQSGAQVNAITPSFVLLILMRINMTEHLMPHVIAQSVFQPWKDINKTAWNKTARSISFTSASHQCPQLVSSPEKWSLERSISWNITPYTHYILLNLLVLIISCMFKLICY